MKRSRDTVCRPQELVLFHYGDLPEADRNRMKGHLEACEVCRRELDAMRSELELLDRLPDTEVELSSEAIRSFNSRLGQKLRPRSRSIFPIPAVWAVPATAVLLLALVLLLPGVGENPPEVALRHGSGVEVLPHPEMLLELDLLENLDLLQELEGPGVRG